MKKKLFSLTLATALFLANGLVGMEKSFLESLPSELLQKIIQEPEITPKQLAFLDMAGKTLHQTTHDDITRAVVIGRWFYNNINDQSLCAIVKLASNDLRFLITKKRKLAIDVEHLLFFILREYCDNEKFHINTLQTFINNSLLDIALNKENKRLINLLKRLGAKQSHYENRDYKTLEEYLKYLEEQSDTKNKLLFIKLNKKGPQCLSKNSILSLAENYTPVEIDLNDNGLTELPCEFCNLITLQRLFLDNNELTDLPPEICNLTKLQKLSLRGNNLSPEALAIVEQLRSKGILVTTDTMISNYLFEPITGNPRPPFIRPRFIRQHNTNIAMEGTRW
ncbi:hypothetical protein KAT92_04170 [Candidatus Babeliales bacterium]|nr:hypothetical protein [Candidatus Babeliales bacterium]